MTRHLSRRWRAALCMNMPCSTRSHPRGVRRNGTLARRIGLGRRRPAWLWRATQDWSRPRP
jgi:hypothetical protein